MRWQSLVELGAYLAIAYLAMLLAVVVHEVLGHGLAAVWLGGSFEGFVVSWDGMGYANTVLPLKAGDAEIVTHLLAGIVATTIVGLPAMITGLWLVGSRWRMAWILIGAQSLLDGLGYLFINGLFPRPPGDVGRVLIHILRTEGLSLSQSLRWMAVALGGLGTAAVLFLVAREMLDFVQDRLPTPAVHPVRRKLLILLGFFILPVALGCYSFDWSQIIYRMDQTPSHIILSLAITVAAVVFVLRCRRLDNA